MAYDFYNSYLTIATDPSDTYKNELQAFINAQYDNSSSFYTIEEEDAFGTQTYSEIQARITHVIDPKTGEKQGDDYRNIIFKDVDTQKKLGTRYRFDNNIWLAINSDYYKYTTQNLIVRRSNATLKFYDEDGVLREEPCVINASGGINPFKEDKNMRLVEGSSKCYVQKNSISTKIKEGDSFLLGLENLVAKYEVSFDNDFEFSDIFKFSLTRYQINPEVDNIDLGIADYTTRPQFTLDVAPIVSEISISDTVQINYSLLNKDGQESSKPVVYSSSNVSIATVSATGLVTAVTNGSATITVAMQNNSSVSDTTGVTVTATPSVNVEYVVDNGTDRILRSQEESYTVEKLVNGTITAETYTISVDGASTANSDDYTFELVGNDEYKITNIKANGTVIVDITPDTDVGNAFSVTYDLVNSYW